MTKLMKKIRSVLKSLGHKAKLSISIALSIPGFLKVEVEYEKTLAPPGDPTAALRSSACVSARVFHAYRAWRVSL